jgi:hypothetical protein
LNREADFIPIREDNNKEEAVVKYCMRGIYEINILAFGPFVAYSFAKEPTWRYTKRNKKAAVAMQQRLNIELAPAYSPGPPGPVPSALAGLTALFGMGRGVPPPPKAPTFLLRAPPSGGARRVSRTSLRVGKGRGRASAAGRAAGDGPKKKQKKRKLSGN